MKSISKFVAMSLVDSGEFNNGEYLVEVEQCMSIKEIVEKFAKGISVDVSVFDGTGEEFEDDDIDRLDQPQYDVDRLDVEQAKLDIQSRFDSAREQAKRREPSEEKTAEEPKKDKKDE